MKKIRSLLMSAALLVAGWTFPVAAQSGTSCVDPIPLNSSSCTNDIVTSTNEIWLSFNASSVNQELTYTVTDLGYSNYETMTVYEGSCTSLAVITQGALSNLNEHIISLQCAGLTIGSTYWIHLQRTQALVGGNPNAKFNICIRSLSTVNAYWGGCLRDANGNVYYCCYDPDLIAWDYMATDCGLVDTFCVGDSVYLQHAITNPNYIMDSSFFAAWQFQGGSCAGTYIDTTFTSWACAYSTPGVYNVGLGYFWDDPNGPNVLLTGVRFQIYIVAPPVANLSLSTNNLCLSDTLYLTSIGNGITNLSFFVDGIEIPNCIVPPSFGCDSVVTVPDNNMTIPFLQPGVHTASLVVYNDCGSDTTYQSFQVLNPNPCFTYESTCRVDFFADTLQCANGVVSHFWDFGDGFNSTGPSVTHVFPNDNQAYLVTHTIVTALGDTLSCTLSVIQFGGPSSQITGLIANNCGSGVISYTAPCASGLVYTWSVNGGSGTLVSPCQYDVSWSNGGGFVILTAFDPVADCTTDDTLFIPGCCDAQNSVQINNRTASSVLNDPAFASYVNNGAFSSLAQSVVINGVFTIDVPFTFLNCLNINLGANARIVVNAGQTFTLDNSRTQTTCGYMWDGIYLNGPTSVCNIINGSNIQQARNAVVSNAGGHFTVENATLRNNYKDIVVNAYSGTHTGSVRNSTFTMNAPFLAAIPALPFGHTKTVCAIEISNNSQITIGDASQAAYRNRFNNVLVGIRSKNSRTTVVNAEFTNFNPNIVQTFVPDAGTGIVSIGGKATNNYLASLTVGGTGNARCLFDNMKTGINVMERSNNYIYNNTIRKVSIYGIRIFNADAYSIDISGNTITNTGNVAFNAAITLVECYNATVNIINNTINQSAVQSLQNGVGIQVSLASPSSMTMNVMNNTIRRVKTGVWLINLTGPSNVWVKGNNVNFFKPNAFYTTTHYGIRLENCVTVTVDSNYVSKNGSAPNSGMVTLLRGISIENSPGSLVINNTMTRLGSGLFGFEISSFSTLACNTMDRCYNGVFFTGSSFTNNACDIGNQVVDPNNTPAATGNTWIANQGQFQIDGDVAPSITWRWDATSPSSGATNVTLSQVNYNACSTFFALSPAVITRDKEVGTLLRNAADTNISVEHRYQVHRYAHRKLHQNPMWLQLGYPDDTLYQNFYNNYNPTNLGVLRQLEVGVDTGSAQYVEGTCNNMTCSNLIEHNAKVVYTIYSAIWMNGVYNFTSADSAALLVIANLDPVEGGTAVYSARVMLDLPVDYSGGNTQRIMQSDDGSPNITVGEVFPNPSSGDVQLDFQIEENQVASVEIRDISGKVILTQTLSANQSLHSIASSRLSDGIYVLRVIVDGEEAMSQRLIITKD